MRACYECGAKGVHAEDCTVLTAAATAPRACYDCGGVMCPIRIYLGPGSTPTPYSEFAEPKSWITGAYPFAGYVHAARCEGCGAVQLFAAPNERPDEELLPIPAEERQDRPDNLPLPATNQESDDAP